MTFFYFDQYATADDSAWDPVKMRVISWHTSATDTWLEDNANLDLELNSGNVIILGTIDDEQKLVLKKLINTGERIVNDTCSGVSKITRDGESSRASSISLQRYSVGMHCGPKNELAKANRA